MIERHPAVRADLRAKIARIDGAGARRHVRPCGVEAVDTRLIGQPQTSSTTKSRRRGRMRKAPTSWIDPALVGDL